MVKGADITPRATIVARILQSLALLASTCGGGAAHGTVAHNVRCGVL